MTFNKELAGFIVITILGILAIISLNLMWLLGYNGELRAAALCLDVAVATLFLDTIRKFLKIKKNGG